MATLKISNEMILAGVVGIVIGFVASKFIGKGGRGGRGGRDDDDDDNGDWCMKNPGRCGNK